MNASQPHPNLAEITAKTATDEFHAIDMAALLKQQRHNIAIAQTQGAPIGECLQTFANCVDACLKKSWLNSGLDQRPVCLIAVGGYGRSELHPYSDIDLLILLDKHPDSVLSKLLEAWVTQLWDLGLEIGHSVRTLEECCELAGADHTIITNLIEARIITGGQSQFDTLMQRLSPQNLWNAETFFNAKLAERNHRHQHFGDTAYRVEPNLKEGPGGLRDIHMLNWVKIRAEPSYTGGTPWLEPAEAQTLAQGREFLWTIRFHLHNLTGRKEDRLLFDYQQRLAELMGYQGVRNEAVEALMHRYYTTITELERLCDVIIGVLQQTLSPNTAQTQSLGEYYLIQGQQIAVLDDTVFQQYPTALIEIFTLLQTKPELSGIAPNTLRWMRQSLDLIDDHFRQQPRHRELFIHILRQNNRITFVLRLMNRYGILAAYIPAFAHIVGRMQYDLFHAYTVDEHTLHVISQARRNTTKKGKAELPLCAEIFDGLRKPELLYIAAIFHDIGKGHDGDHSEIGAEIVRQFCQEHGLHLHDTQRVSWLVRQHLLMSVTAQRRDISDPTVIQAFAARVLDLESLDYLFLLTVADMRGTNPKLWNAWKATLLTELYHSTRAHLNLNEPNPKTEDIIRDKRSSALSVLQEKGITAQQCETFWANVNPDYFLHHSIESICWHLEQIVTSKPLSTIVKLRTTRSKSSNVLMVYTKDFTGLFALVVSCLEVMQLNIVQARLVDIKNQGFDLYTLHVLRQDNTLISDRHEQLHIEETLKQQIISTAIPPHSRRTPRQLKHFDIRTRIQFKQLPQTNTSRMILNCADSPGLLSRIGQVFFNEGIKVRDARISTLGEQAEDIFFLENLSGTALSESQQSTLETLLIQAIEQARK